MGRHDPFRAVAEAHIAAAGRHTPADRDRLAAILRSWCWPARRSDGAVARGWVSQWEPSCVGAVDLECTCARGRCALCN
jgi:hypothetical protein